MFQGVKAYVLQGKTQEIATKSLIFYVFKAFYFILKRISLATKTKNTYAKKGAKITQ